MKNRISGILLTLFLSLYVGICLYFNRSLFFTRFDISYWQERFDQSQWRLAFTERIIGDEGLYAYEGYSYANGADPTLSNAEAPPLGKYLIGWSIKLTGNPYWAGFVCTIFSIIVFYRLTKRTTRSGTLALTGSIIFAFDPLVFQQTKSIMLDSSQLLFLLLSMYLLTLLDQTKIRKHSGILIFASGLFLGAFSAVKIPMLTPFFIMGVLIYFKKLHVPVVFSGSLFICGTALSYLASYLRYFLLNHSIVEWLMIQKWMIAFYRESQLDSNFGSILTTLLFNSSQNVFSGLWEKGDIWSITWPCITALSILYILRVFIRKKSMSPILFLYTFISIIATAFYFIVPFSTRYLVILLPFLYLLSFQTLSVMKHSLLFYMLIVILFIGNSFALYSIVFPTPERDIQQFAYDWEHGYFSDMYERLDSSSQSIDKRTFHRTGQTYWSDAQIEKVHITVSGKSNNRFSSFQQFPVLISYKTQFLGEFSEEQILTAVKENSIWKFHWNFSHFMTNLGPDSKLVSAVEFAKRGSISNSKKTLAYDFPSILISVIPNKIDPQKENEMVSFLEFLFDGDIKSASIHDRYIVARVPDLPVPIGVVPKELTHEERTTLLSFPGIIIRPAMGRHQILKGISGIVKNSSYTECCSLLYSTSSYDGISGFEQTYNDQLKGINGGTLHIIGKDGTLIRSIIRREKRDGKDIVVSTE